MSASIRLGFVLAVLCSLCIASIQGCFGGGSSGGNTVPSVCRDCEKWRNDERRDLAWLREVNRMFQCPCRTRPGPNGHQPLDHLVGNWEVDSACSRHGRPSCATYHPGADGCLRSGRTTPRNARQQCCYTNTGSLIRPGSRAAGTPDKSANVFSHYFVDVRPYNKCCRDCSIQPKYCNYYVNEVRKGNADHC